jgi:hypothetical protein
MLKYRPEWVRYTPAAAGVVAGTHALALFMKSREARDTAEIRYGSVRV